MLGLKFELFLPKRKVKAVAELLEDEAPKTCEMIWSMLEKPIESTVIHAKFAGREVWFEIRKPPKKIEPENLTVFPIPGDIMYVHYPPRVVRGYPNGLHEFAIFYGREGHCFQPIGWAPGNLFATIVENLDEFASACENIHREGIEKIIARRK